MRTIKKKSDNEKINKVDIKQSGKKKSDKMDLDDEEEIEVTEEEIEFHGNVRENIVSVDI